ncbi:MAG: ComEC/Rec2 family competence protein [Helicobacteraceae bacterium]|nr:ComEC/Rec2 family competence protein [Helicobacteraceae bacterium]
MEDVVLFRGFREWFLFISACVFIFALNVFTTYLNYRDFSAKKFVDINATVESQSIKYNKKDKRYFVLKLNSDKHGVFWTTTYENIIDLSGKEVSLVAIAENIGFYDYFKGFYAPSFKISLMPYFFQNNNVFSDLTRNSYDRAVAFTRDQHENEFMRELFPAMFFASPQSKELRQNVTKYAAAHLIALSGFHLGILALLIAFIFGKIYRVSQNKFFPYRNYFYDLGIFSILVLGFYLIFTGIVPSLLRAYAMFLFGFFLAIRNIKIISFNTLLIVTLLLIAMQPKLVFSIGFILSVSGVFYIFLYLRYFKNQSKIISAIGLSVYVFLAMLPIVHFYFPLTAHTQLFAPILTIVYAPFFIAEIALHIIGFGDVLDPFIIKAIEWNVNMWDFKVNLLWFLTYIVISIAAIFHRIFHYIFIAFFITSACIQYIFN